MSPPLSSLGTLTGAPTLLVLLPGAYMSAVDFASAGFFTALAQRGRPLDLLTLDLNLATISSGKVLPRLQAEILTPAREQGCRNLWLGGISLGGLLALCHAVDWPGQVDGLCLLAPYPGSRLTTKAIAAAGGLARWQPTPEQLADPEFRVWDWLRQPPPALPVFIGYGRDDRFAAGMQAIAACFSPSASLCLPGGHEWPVWRRLWEHFLDHWT